MDALKLSKGNKTRFTYIWKSYECDWTPFYSHVMLDWINLKVHLLFGVYYTCAVSMHWTPWTHMAIGLDKAILVSDYDESVACLVLDILFQFSCMTWMIDLEIFFFLYTNFSIKSLFVHKSYLCCLDLLVKLPQSLMKAYKPNG